MVKLTIFLCGVLYFVDLSFSRVLDFSEESKYLCEIAGIENRSCTDSENKLIKEAYKFKQGAEIQRERVEEWKTDAKSQRERAKGAECAKDILSIPLQKLKLRSVIEDAVKTHYPGDKPNRLGYFDAFREMIVSNAIRFTEKAHLMVFRGMIDQSPLGTERFLEVTKELYSKISDQGGHNLEGYHIVKLPDDTDEEKIVELLKCIVTPVKKDYIATVQLLLKTNPLTPKKPTIPLEELCCIRIEAQSQGEEKLLQKIKADVKDEDVYPIFPRSKPKKIEYKNVNEKSPQNSQFVIMVHFNEEKEAKKALDFSNRFLKDVLITLEQTTCNGLPTMSETSPNPSTQSPTPTSDTV